jgi:hypothetical protein
MFKHRSKILGALIILSAAIGANAIGAPNKARAETAAPFRPLPGFWQFSTKAGGVYSTNDSYCLSQVEIDKFYQNPCNRSNTCTYKTKSFNPDGSVYLDGVWTDKKRRSTKIKGNGTFKSDYLRLKLNVVLSFGLPVSGTFEAKRLSAQCR